MRWLISLPLCLLTAVALAGITRTPLPWPDRFTARTTLPLTVEKLLPILQQPCQVRRWMPGVQQVRILAHPGAGQTRVYMARSAPWPLQNRDAVTLFSSQPGDPWVITMQGQPAALPPRPGYVRMPLIEGRWSLQASAGATLVEYRQRLDPGGDLPQWLADRLAPSQIHRTLEALQDYVRHPHPAACPADHAAAAGSGKPLW
ncbi:MAG: START domain-containing protein [Alcanivorax sp.]|nr:START domain-containing protein [Alcanivorax sp.]